MYYTGDDSLNMVEKRINNSFLLKTNIFIYSEKQKIGKTSLALLFSNTHCIYDDCDIDTINYLIDNSELKCITIRNWLVYTEPEKFSNLLRKLKSFNYFIIEIK